MSAWWIPVASALAIVLLSLGVLEVMSAGVRVDQPAPAAWRSWAAPPSGPIPDDVLTPDRGDEATETRESAGSEDR